MLSGLAEDSQFFKDRLNLIMLLAPPARIDNTKLKGFLIMCRLNELNPSLVQSPSIGGPIS